MTEAAALEAVDLAAGYRGGRAGDEVRALAGVSRLFAPGTLTAITGPSGLDKTTLLHCLPASSGRPPAPSATPERR